MSHGRCVFTDLGSILFRMLPQILLHVTSCLEWCLLPWLNMHTAVSPSGEVALTGVMCKYMETFLAVTARKLVPLPPRGQRVGGRGQGQGSGVLGNFPLQRTQHRITWTQVSPVSELKSSHLFNLSFPGLH